MLVRGMVMTVSLASGLRQEHGQDGDIVSQDDLHISSIQRTEWLLGFLTHLGIYTR